MSVTLAVMLAIESNDVGVTLGGGGVVAEMEVKENLVIRVVQK